MQTLQDILRQDRRARKDSRLQEQDFRRVIEVAAPVFREATRRGAFPVTIENDPGVLESAHLEVIDLTSAHHGMSGTGGTYDRVSKKLVKVKAYAIWENIEVPWREGESARRGGFNLLTESGRAAAQVVGETENKMLSVELGPVSGLSKVSGIQTFAAAAAWTTAGQAWKDVIKAVRDKLQTKKVPIDNVAVAVNPTDEANFWQVFGSTSALQMETAQKFLPGGIHTFNDLPAGKAYFYARTPTVVEYRVYQDLTVVPLPKVDEDERMRVRVIGAFHAKKADGIVEVTGI
jgi:hypothetical protein